MNSGFLAPFKVRKIGVMALNFIKVTTVHIFLETVISVYLLEIFVLFSRFFMSSIPDLATLIRIITIPFGITLAGALVCTIVFVIAYLPHVNRFINAYKKEQDSDKLRKKYNRQVILVHSIGIALYIVVSIGVAYFLAAKYGEAFISVERFKLWVPILATVMGSFWNVAGMFRNRRVSWSELLPGINSTKLEDKFKDRVKESNYSFFIWNALIVLLCALFVVGVNLYTLLNLNTAVFEQFDEIITSYSFLYVFFVFVCTFYARYAYNNVFGNPSEKKRYLFNTVSELMRL